MTKTCVTCNHCVKTPRQGGKRSDYACDVANTDCYAAREPGKDCGPDGNLWTTVRRS